MSRERLHPADVQVLIGAAMYVMRPEVMPLFTGWLRSQDPDITQSLEQLKEALATASMEIALESAWAYGLIE